MSKASTGIKYLEKQTGTIFGEIKAVNRLISQDGQEDPRIRKSTRSQQYLQYYGLEYGTWKRRLSKENRHCFAKQERNSAQLRDDWEKYRLQKRRTEALEQNKQKIL